MTTEELAGEIGSSVRSVKRWIASYREHGLSGLRNVRAYDGRIPSDVEQEIGRQSDQALACWLFSFIASLPERVTTREWIDAFRESLRVLLDVTRISVDLNLNAIQPLPPNTTHSIAILETMEGGTQRRSTVAVTTERRIERAQEIIDRIIGQGLARDRFHEPLAREYYLTDGIYLGTLIVWQERVRSAVSPEQERMLDQLRPILVRLMIDCAAREEGSRPTGRHFYESLRRLVVECNLTRSEEHALTLRLLGQSYKDIAAALGTSVDTVGKHLTSVHRKTKSSGLAQLSALIFSPRLK